MSLLMEALKKAEEDKRRAALEQGSRTGEHPIAPPAADSSAAPAAEAVGETTRTSTGELALEPIEERGRSEPGETAESDEDERTRRLPKEGMAIAEEPILDLFGGGEPLSGAEPYDQESTVPSARAVKQSVEEYFESSQSMEKPRVAPAAVAPSPAASPAEATPVAAQTIFSAKTRPTSTRWVGAASVMIALVAVAFGVAGLWFYLRTPATTFVPSPMVARDVEKIVPEPLQVPPVAPPAEVVAPAPVTELATAAPPAVPVDGGPQATAAVPEPAPAAVPVESAAPAEEVAPAVPEAAAAVEPEPAPPAAARPSIETPAVASAEAPAATVTDLLPATDETIDVAPGEVRISRAKSPDEASRAIMDAYAAYSRGDYPAAESLYRAALAKSPESRDALLGLAAVAMRRGDRQQAADLYGRLLKLNPRDSVAATALVGLRRSDDAGGDESRLKLMMDQTPEPAYLHFALGNVYARQGRWAEAQQAYFEAWRRQNDNSDYIYNLAVSLDHLGSRPAALDYYRKALALADRQTVNFTTSQVMSRIQSLGVADGDVAVP